MVQAVLRAEVELRDRPLALVDGTAPQIHVVAANDAAWHAGIQMGMVETQAQLCGVEIRRRSRAQEKAAHAALLDLGWSMSPRVEDHAQDTILADLAGLNSLFGANENIAHDLPREVTWTIPDPATPHAPPSPARANAAESPRRTIAPAFSPTIPI